MGKNIEKSASNKHPQKVNKVVSFNTIKNHIIDLFYKEKDIDVLLEKLTRLFMTNPVLVRDREVPRAKTSKRKLLQYHKHKKKICF